MSNVRIIRVTEGGSRSVLLDHGWVPYGFLSSDVQQHVAVLVATSAPEKVAREWADGIPMQWVVTHSTTVPTPEPTTAEPSGEGQGEPSGEPSEPTAAVPKRKPRTKAPAQGEGQGDGQGQGGGTPPPNMDEFVRHTVFDPWQQRTDAAIQSVTGQVTDLSNRVGVMGSTLTATSEAVLEVSHKVEGLAGKLAEHDDRLAELAAQVGKPTHLVINTAAAQTVVPMTGGVQHAMFPTLMRCIAAGQHAFLPGPAGSGKSHAAEQGAAAMGWEFASMSLGPTTPESRLWGGMDANGKFHEPPFVRLARYASENPDSGAVFCLDEMDNGHAGILATLNSAMANGWFTSPSGEVVRWGRNFVIVAAANTFGTGPTAEFSGRNRLDAATLDRFAYIPWDTDVDMERALVRGILHEDTDLAVAWLDVWHTARQNVADHGLKAFVTMRGAQNGARLLLAGFTIREAYDLVLGSKLPADQAHKVSPF